MVKLVASIKAEFENVDALEPDETTFWFTLSCSSCREVQKAPVAIDSTVRHGAVGALTRAGGDADPGLARLGQPRHEGALLMTGRADREVWLLRQSDERLVRPGVQAQAVFGRRRFLAALRQGRAVRVPRLRARRVFAAKGAPTLCRRVHAPRVHGAVRDRQARPSRASRWKTGPTLTVRALRLTCACWHPLVPAQPFRDSLRASRASSRSRLDQRDHHQNRAGIVWRSAQHRRRLSHQCRDIDALIEGRRAG